jgi:serine phosphatase RsbU (regulator of sigma subunit)
MSYNDYVRENTLHEIKADKFPIGVNLDGVVDNYQNHTIQLQKGDCVYLFSDGYADQFGGEKGKKFKYNQLKNLFIEIAKKPVDEQKQIIANAFDVWKGGLEQVDDVVVIGLKI